MAYAPIPGASVAPISASGVAALPIATIIDKLREAARDHWRQNAKHLQQIFAERIAAGDVDENLRGILEPNRAFEPASTGATGAPVRYGREHYVDVALLYLAAWQDGSNPTQAVADRYGVSRSAAAKWVSRARSSELQLLSPAEHGRSGASAGPGLMPPAAKKPARKRAAR